MQSDSESKSAYCLSPVKVTLAGFREQVIVTDAELAQVKFTVPVKPLIAVTVTVEVPATPEDDDEATVPSRAKSPAEVVAVHAVMRLATLSDPGR